MSDARRLGEAMEQRRIQLRMKWTQVAAKADLSQAGLGAIRRGERHPSALTRANIEDALSWMPGSVEAILAGGNATPIGTLSIDVNSASTPQELRQQIAELREEVRFLTVKHERNRPYIVDHLERRIAELQHQLDAFNNR